MAKREGSRIFHHVSSAFEGRPLLEGRGGGILFSFFVKRVFDVFLSGERAYRLFM